jgi:hypothetical protein
VAVVAPFARILYWPGPPSGTTWSVVELIPDMKITASDGSSTSSWMLA